MRAHALPTAVVAGLALGAISCVAVEAESETVTVEERIRSVTLSARHVVDDATIASLVDLGATHVALVPFAHQRSHTDPDLRFDPSTRWFTESDFGIRTVAKTAGDLGLGTILKPHIWVGSYAREGLTRDRIGFEQANDWRTWEVNYRRYILHHARLAAEIGSDVFVVGTELARVARERPDFFRHLIADVRTEFSGRLTYAANWYQEYEEIAFWPDLDFVGVQAYFPISDAESPTVEDLQDGWRVHLESLQEASRSSGRPVLFTEIGYRSVASAAREPWTWARRDAVGREEPDYDLQSQLYSAFFESVWQEEWFGGAILWRWHVAQDRDRAVREIDFTPQQKPSEAIVRAWFRRDSAY